MKFICILFFFTIFLNYSICNLRKVKEGNLTKLARKLKVDVAKKRNSDFPFESKDKNKKQRKNNINNFVNSNGNNELSQVSGPAKSLYGEATDLPSKYEPNKYPKCLLEKSENSHHTQFKLKKCTLKHIFNSIDISEQSHSLCITKYSEVYSKKGQHKGVAYLLSDLINFASKGNQERLFKKLSICGDQFVNEFMSKYQQYQSNFKIALSLFVDLNNPQISPPNAPEGLKFE